MRNRRTITRNRRRLSTPRVIGKIDFPLLDSIARGPILSTSPTIGQGSKSDTIVISDDSEFTLSTSVNIEPVSVKSGSRLISKVFSLDDGDEAVSAARRIAERFNMVEKCGSLFSLWGPRKSISILWFSISQ